MHKDLQSTTFTRVPPPPQNEFRFEITVAIWDQHTSRSDVSPVIRSKLYGSWKQWWHHSKKSIPVAMDRQYYHQRLSSWTESTIITVCCHDQTVLSSATFAMERGYYRQHLSSRTDCTVSSKSCHGRTFSFTTHVMSPWIVWHANICGFKLLPNIFFHWLLVRVFLNIQYNKWSLTSLVVTELTLKLKLVRKFTSRTESYTTLRKQSLLHIPFRT